MVDLKALGIAGIGTVLLLGFIMGVTYIFNVIDKMFPILASREVTLVGLLIVIAILFLYLYETVKKK